MFEAFFVALSSVWADSGFSALTGGHVIMICVGLLLLYMAIAKGFEPLLLSPIAFGCILANIPKNGFEEPGVMSVIMYGIHHEVFPPLIFLGVGAMTDFGPLLANPKTLLLGAAAQAGVFVALLGAMMLGFSVQEAAAIGIIGGADGPTSIYLAAKMAPQLLGAIAVAAYSYMSLVPLIQPPIMKLFTTEADRKIVMEQLRPVSQYLRCFPHPPVSAALYCPILSFDCRSCTDEGSPHEAQKAPRLRVSNSHQLQRFFCRRLLGLFLAAADARSYNIAV